MRKRYIAGIFLLVSGMISSCVENSNNYIKGIDPYLISYSFKKLDFTTNTSSVEGFGKSWNIEGKDFYASYNISLYSIDNSNNIQSIQASATLNDLNGKIDYSFFHEIALQTKEECDQNIVSNWLSNHYNNAGDTIINQVSFSISQPSELTKILRISKILSDKEEK